jgi:hypothetical protein
MRGYLELLMAIENYDDLIKAVSAGHLDVVADRIRLKTQAVADEAIGDVVEEGPPVFCQLDCLPCALSQDTVGERDPRGDYLAVEYVARHCRRRGLNAQGHGRRCPGSADAMFQPAEPIRFGLPALPAIV